MAWGLREPTGFGKLYPDASSDGYREAIEAYFHAHLTEAERATFDHRPVSFRYAISRKFTEDMGFLEDFEQPRQYRTEVKIKHFASMLLLENGLVAVDSDLKSVIEGFESGVHQFWPITFVSKRGVPYEQEFHGLIVGNHRRAFSREISVAGSWEEREGAACVTRPHKEHFEGIGLSEAAIDGAHLWRDPTFRSLDLYLSDALHDAIAARSLTVWAKYKLTSA